MTTSRSQRNNSHYVQSSLEEHAALSNQPVEMMPEIKIPVPGRYVMDALWNSREISGTSRRPNSLAGLEELSLLFPRSKCKQEARQPSATWTWQRSPRRRRTWSCTSCGLTASLSSATSGAPGRGFLHRRLPKVTRVFCCVFLSQICLLHQLGHCRHCKKPSAPKTTAPTELLLSKLLHFKLPCCGYAVDNMGSGLW